MADVWEAWDGQLTPDDLAKLRSLRAMLKDMAHIKRFNKFVQFHAYPKQLLFFELGTRKNQRMFNAGNRLGKTEAGAFETSCHLTGDYPDWWPGRRFDHPIDAWAAGISAQATRDIVQEKLCGKPLVSDSLGTGMIPLEKFEGPPILGRGITGGYDTIRVKHASGGTSTLGFKAGEQGWEKFQGTAKDWIWLDEEPPDYKIYTECVTRTLDTGGGVIVTYTPLSGETSDLWVAYRDPEDSAKGMVTMSMDEVLSYPNSHINEKMAREIIQSWPAHERVTRRSGKPSVGAGAVFPFDRASVECPPVWDPGGYVKLGWACDFGGMGGSTLKHSHPFGAVLMAYDPTTDILYVIREVRMPGGLVLQHCDAMLRICALAPVFWPHDGHRTANEDVTKDTRDLYREHGLKMYHEHATFKQGGYSTEAGILEMHNRFEGGRLKIAANLPLCWAEFGSYSRNEKGEIVKINDDLMSSMRIGTMMVPRFGRQVPMGDTRRLFTGRLGAVETSQTMASGLDHDPWNP